MLWELLPGRDETGGERRAHVFMRPEEGRSRCYGDDRSRDADGWLRRFHGKEVRLLLAQLRPDPERSPQRRGEVASQVLVQPPSCTACPTQVGTSHASTRKPPTSAREIELGTDSTAVFFTYRPRAGPLVRRPGRAMTHSRPLARTCSSCRSWS